MGVGGVPLPPPPPLIGYFRSPFLDRIVLPGSGQGGEAHPSDRGSVNPPDLLHIHMVWVGRPRRHMPIPRFHYGVRSLGVRPSRGRLQTRPNLRCCFLRSPPGVHHKVPAYVSVDPPCHVSIMVRVPAQGRTLINQLYGILGHSERARGAFQLGGDQFQGIEGLKLSFSPAKFLVG